MKLRFKTVAQAADSHVVEVQQYDKKKGQPSVWRTIDSGKLDLMRTKYPRAKFRNRAEQHLNPKPTQPTTIKEKSA